MKLGLAVTIGSRRFALIAGGALLLMLITIVSALGLRH